MALVVVCVCERRMVSRIISRRRADFFYVKLKHGASSLLRIITNVFLSLHIIWVIVVERFFNLKPSNLFLDHMTTTPHIFILQYLWW